MKILIISAPFSSGRRISAISYAEGTGMPFEVLEGIDGTKLDLVSIPRKGAALGFNPKIIACYMSHIRALEIAASTPEECIIVEDDWKPLGNLHLAIKKIPSNSEYTILHDLNPDDSPGHVDWKGVGWDRMDPPPIVALAYIPTPRFIRAALSEAYPIQDHVDHFYQKLCVKHHITCFRTNPGIVTGAGFPSTLGH